MQWGVMQRQSNSQPNEENEYQSIGYCEGGVSELTVKNLYDCVYREAAVDIEIVICLRTHYIVYGGDVMEAFSLRFCSSMIVIKEVSVD